MDLNNIPERLRDMATLACADFNREPRDIPMQREHRYEWLAADRIEELERQLSTLRETAQAVVVHRHIPHGAHVDLPKLARDIDKMEEVLKEQDSPVVSTGGADQP